jgi:hypothetical protein
MQLAVCGFDYIGHINQLKSNKSYFVHWIKGHRPTWPINLIEKRLNLTCSPQNIFGNTIIAQVGFELPSSVLMSRAVNEFRFDRVSFRFVVTK